MYWDKVPTVGMSWEVEQVLLQAKPLDASDWLPGREFIGGPVHSTLLLFCVSRGRMEFSDTLVEERPNIQEGADIVVSADTLVSSKDVVATVETIAIFFH
jgi:hypothetical protein